MSEHESALKPLERPGHKDLVGALIVKAHALAFDPAQARNGSQLCQDCGDQLFVDAGAPVSRRDVNVADRSPGSLDDIERETNGGLALKPLVRSRAGRHWAASERGAGCVTLICRVVHDCYESAELAS